MPHCIACQAEYEEGMTTCADCGKPLEPGPLPIPEEPPPTNSEWTFLTECPNDLDAELLKQLLESEGIAVLRKGSLRGSYGLMGSVANWPGERIVLLVPDDELGRATRIIQNRLIAGHKVANIRREAIAERARILRRRRKRQP